MPDIPKQVDRICMYCDHYYISVAEGGPVCLKHNSPFPDPRGWVRGESKKPGLRTCAKWETKTHG